MFPRLPCAYTETLQNRKVKAEALSSPAEVLCTLSGAWEGGVAWGISLFRVPGVLDPGTRGYESQKTGKELQFTDIPTTLTKWIQLHDGSIKCY